MSIVIAVKRFYILTMSVNNMTPLGLILGVGMGIVLVILGLIGGVSDLGEPINTASLLVLFGYLFILIAVK